MKKNAMFFNRRLLAPLVIGAFAVAFLCVPAREANASSFGLSINTGAVSFGLGVADPYPTYVVAPAPRYMPPPPPPRYLPPPPPPRYMPPPPPRPVYRPPVYRRPAPMPPPGAYRW